MLSGSTGSQALAWEPTVFEAPASFRDIGRRSLPCIAFPSGSLGTRLVNEPFWPLAACRFTNPTRKRGKHSMHSLARRACIAKLIVFAPAKD